MEQLTTEAVQRFTRGQAVIHRKDLPLLRGEVEIIRIASKTLKMRFAWLAREEEGRWLTDDKHRHAVSLGDCQARDIGYGRLHLKSSLTGEVVILYPPDNKVERLDPSLVEGLELK